MFGVKAARIQQLEHKTQVLESNLTSTERRLEHYRKTADRLRHSLIVRDNEVVELKKQLDNPFRVPLHQHNFAELEARTVADMMRRPDLYGTEAINNLRGTGRWSARNPALQNIRKDGHTRPELVNISFEYKGKRHTYAVHEHGTERLSYSLVQGGETLRVFCRRRTGVVHYDYVKSQITSEIRKEYAE